VNITHLRDGTPARDRAILDTLELLEAGLVPGWAATADLMARWSRSQPQVSRRLAAVNRLGIVRVTTEYGRYYLRRSKHAGDAWLWRAAVCERRKVKALRRRAYRRLEPERAAKWELLRARLAAPCDELSTVPPHP
jgi:hypothetical protein